MRPAVDVLPAKIDGWFLIVMMVVAAGWGTAPAIARQAVQAYSLEADPLEADPLEASSAAAARAALLTTPRAAGGLDAYLLYGIYRNESPAFRWAMRTADATAYPVFFGGVAATWVGTLAFGGERQWEHAYRLTLSQVTAVAAVIGLKKLFNRNRPFVTHPDITSRTTLRRPGTQQTDPYSFPSGHATVAFTLGVSWSLSYPRWYVVAPALLWATGVALSRVWLGVHYPSDILAGALLGTAAAVLVHYLGPHITPRRQGLAAEEPGGMPLVRLRLPLR